MKKQFLSNGTSKAGRVWQLLMTMIFLFSLGIGQMWAAYSPVNNPATKTYAELTFLDVANTKANGKITADGATFKGDSTLAYSLRYVGQTLAITTWYNCSDGSPASNFESSPTYTAAEANGFVAPSSTSGNIGYGGAKAHSGRVRYFYATGITSVAIISHDNQASKYVQLKIEEVASNGDLSAVTTIDSPNKSSSTLSLIEYTTALNPAKYYKISCTSNNSSNCKVYQIRFGKYIAPAATYTVTYLPGAGSGPEYIIDDDATTVGDCPAQFSYTGHDFAGWKDALSNDVAVGATVTSDMTLTAQWVEHVAKYTVKYMDGTTELGTEEVNVGSTPAGLASDPTKDCYTFAAWSPALSGVSGTDGQVVNVNATWTPIYSSSATLISDAVVSGKPNVNTVFAASNIVSSITFTSGNYEFTNNETKPGYYGYKDKASGDYMKIMLKQGKRAQVLFGNLGADPTITVNGVAKSLDASRATGDMAENTFTWTASAEDALISITMGSGTNTLKKVDIIQLYTATRVDGKSDGAGSDANVLETTLPTPTAISGWTFTGWTANEDVKVGEDTKTAGTILGAGTYTLLANTTFEAQWAEASTTYDITYVSAHGTAPANDNAASVVLAELDAEGWAHKGWTANVDVTVDAATVEAGTLIANGKTAVLASNVTFTAVWKEIFTVTFDSKGGSSVSPIDVEDGASIAAAPANPTKDDYIFQGWSETDGGDVVADITALTISADKTLYAKWKLDVQVSLILFSNNFRGWIHDSKVEVFYMAGESAPTIASYDGKNLKAEDGVVISGDKIIATGTDDSEIEFALTMTAVTPLTATGAQTFDGSETYVKTRYAWTPERKWKMAKHATDGRVARGECSLYLFLGPAESVTLDWGAQKVTEDAAVYVNGAFVKKIGKNNNSAIELSNGNNMVALYSLQTSGDIWLNGLTVAPWVPVTGVTLKEGEDAISSKEIYAGANFTLTAEVTPDYASNKTITWTSSDDAVATVVNGVVTGVTASASPVTITASTVDGVTATCAVTVTTAPEPSADPVITEQPASANYYEGATIAALKVVATGESLTYQWYKGSDAIEGATGASYTPEVSAIGSYVYHCVVTNTEAGNLPTSLATDNATITIADDPAAIKLLDGEGNVNTTNFTTGVTAGTVNFDDADHNCASFGSTGGTIVGLTGLNKVVAYNATTTQTKVKFVLYNTNSSAKELYLQKVLEGATVAVTETISVPSKEYFETQYYTYNSSDLRSFYVTVNSTNIKILQVKVIDNGTALKRAGEAGYELNLNQGRVFGAQNVATNFEGLAFAPSSNAKVLNSTELPITTPLSFTIATPLTLTVETSAAKYYVSQNALEDGTTATAVTSAGEEDFDLTVTGTWYIVPSTTSAVKLTNISFAAPKCEKPVITTEPETNTNFGAGNLTATVVAAEPTEGTLSYQWYNADDDAEVAGATEATLTTTTEGTYYVIVTNKLAGYQDNSTKSAEATLGYRVMDDATLSALGYGDPATAIALEADKYEYRIDLAEGTIDVPVLSATATKDGYADVVISDAAAFENYEATSTVLVTAEDGVTQKTYVVKFVVDHVYTALVDVTESTTWNWTGDVQAVINDVDNKGLILANYIDGANFEMIEGKYNEYARRTQNDGVYQGTYLHFNTTVAGKVKIYFRAPSSGENCTITVKNNGKEMVAGTRGNSFGWSKEIVVKGDVVIEMENDKEGGGMTRVQQLVFTELTPDYTRNVSNNIGTLCVDHNVMVGGAMGATFYQIAGRNATYPDKIDFDEVAPNEELKAGEPYIFQSTTGKIDLFYAEGDAVTEPAVVNGMHGVLVAGHLDITEDNMMDVYYISENKLRDCSNLLVDGLNLVANRAYIVMSEVDAVTSAPAPGRRRISIGGANVPAVTTGIENAQLDNAPVKMIINGQLFILRGEKMYDATGRLVK